MNMMFIVQLDFESGRSSNDTLIDTLIDVGIKLSYEAFNTWKKTTISKRQEILNNFFYQVGLKKKELIETICGEQRQSEKIVKTDFVRGLG